MKNDRYKPKKDFKPNKDFKPKNDFKSKNDFKPKREEDEGEIDIQIEPRIHKLEELGVTIDELSDAIEAALDKEEAQMEDFENSKDVCPLEEIPVELNGKTYKLEELAEIEVSGDVDLLF